MAFDPNFGNYISSISSIKLQTGRWLKQSFGPISIVYKQVNSDTTIPSLVVIPDFNNSSYQKITDIVTGMEHHLSKKYHMIYIINWCGIDNTVEKRYDDIKEDKDVIELGLRFARYIDLIFVNKYKMNNIHLLAHSYGSMVATYMVHINPIYKGLFLSSPSIPSDVYSIKQLGDKLKNIKLRFAWNIDSNNIDMKECYDNIDYKSRYYEPGFMNSIHPDFILDIIN
jgi:hypothetical protein